MIARSDRVFLHDFLSGSTAPNDLPRIGALRQSRRAFDHFYRRLCCERAAFTQFVPSRDARVYDCRVGPRYTTRFDSPNDTSASSRLGRYGKAAG